jgi:octaprenyl-diphosphate synthase
MSAIVDLPTGLLPLQRFVVDALGRVERRFDAQLRSDLLPVRRLCQHVERYRGKMLRPMLVVLCGLATEGAYAEGRGDDDAFDISEEHVSLAAVCEMIHMATLVHDDVLDEADTRRRGATVNRLHGNETAVILGDYLFSAAYHLCSGVPGAAGREAALLIGKTGMTLCAGELLQLHHRDNFSLDEQTYFEIVERKTGSLIAAACRLGSLHSLPMAAAGSDLPERLAKFGMKLGVAFQIQDDLLDLTGTQSVVGKSVGKDFELGKLTLPMIHHLANAAVEDRAATLGILSGHARDGGHAPARLVAALEGTGSIAYARAAAKELVDEAKALIAGIGDSAAKRMLMVMADAVVDRAF